MPEYVNVPDFIKIGLIALVFAWLANKALDAASLSNFKV